MSEYFTIDTARLAAIAAEVRAARPDISEAQVRDFCLADWSEEEHQRWIAEAPVEEIASWVDAGIEPGA